MVEPGFGSRVSDLRDDVTTSFSLSGSLVSKAKWSWARQGLMTGTSRIFEDFVAGVLLFFAGGGMVFDRCTV